MTVEDALAGRFHDLGTHGRPQHDADARNAQAQIASALKLGDVVVLSRDILTVPEEEIPGTRVDATIVGGRIAYRP